jgi:hypothetical protein
VQKADKNRRNHNDYGNKRKQKTERARQSVQVQVVLKI